MDDTIRHGARPSTKRARDNMIGPDIRERFDMIEQAYKGDLDFDKIPVDKRLDQSPYICGILKVAQMLKEPSKFYLHGEHDEIYFNDLNDFEPFSDDDIIYLLRCGVRAKQGSLHMFSEG